MRAIALISLALVLLLVFTFPTNFQDGSEQGSVEKDLGNEYFGSIHPISSGLTMSSRNGGLYNGMISYDDVGVIINIQSAKSQEIGNFFISERSIPPENVFYVNVSSAETVSRAIFNDMRAQLEENITDRGLTNKLNYLVTTKGVPLRTQSPNSAVDSELAMMLGPQKNQIGAAGWQNNPYAGSGLPFSREEFGIYLVTRLTGYTVEEAKNLVNLSSNSYGNDGTFLLDLDTNKDGNPGYKVGNDWMRLANTTLVDKGFDTYMEESGTFVKDFDNVIGYTSWGSNDGNNPINYLPNANLDTDTSPADGMPDGWETDGSGVTWTMDANSQSGAWSMKADKASADTQIGRFYQDYTIHPNSRYWMTGQINVTSISGGNGVYFQAVALDASDNPLAYYNSSARTSPTDWRGLSQIHFEPVPGTVKARVGVVVDGSQIVAYADTMRFYRVEPEIGWIDGSIAETYVSTGGRSMNYGTSYGQSLIADLVRDGVSGVSGHVFEPYLTACCRPYLMFDAYTYGMTMAESFYMGLPFLGWMEVVVGDPKMCPYIDNWAEVSFTSAQIDRSEYYQGDFVELSAQVQRTGFQWDREFNVTAHMFNSTSGPLQTQEVTLNIENFDSVWVNFTFDTSDIIGNYEILIEIDPLSELREIDESNNEAGFQFLIYDEPLITDVQFSSTELLRGETANITVFVEDKITPYDEMNLTGRYHIQDMGWHDLSLVPAEEGTWTTSITPLYSFPLKQIDFDLNLTNEFGLSFERTIYSAISIQNNLPEIIDIEVDPELIDRSRNASVRVLSRDLEDSVTNMTCSIKYSYDGTKWFVLGGIKPTKGEFEATFKPASNSQTGVLSFKAQITDSDGGLSTEVTSNAALSVINTPPLVTSLEISPAMVYRGETLYILINASDFESLPGDLTLDLEYRIAGEWLDVQKPLNIEGTDSFTASFEVTKEMTLEPISFRVKALDPDTGETGWFYRNNSVFVKNNLPSIASFDVDVWRIYRSGVVNISMSGTDFEDSHMKLYGEVMYSIDNGSWMDIDDITNEGSQFKGWLEVPPDADIGTMKFRARVMDSDTKNVLNTPWETQSPEIEIMNNPPAFIELVCPESQNTNDSVFALPVTVWARDVEDDEVTVLLNWTLDEQTGSIEMERSVENKYEGTIDVAVSAEGKYSIDLSVLITDEDGGWISIGKAGSSVLVYERDIENVDDDDDTQVSGAFYWWIIPVLIIILIIVIVIVLFIIKRRSWPYREQPPGNELGPTLEPSVLPAERQGHPQPVAKPYHNHAKHPIPAPHAAHTPHLTEEERKALPPAAMKVSDDEDMIFPGEEIPDVDMADPTAEAGDVGEVEPGLESVEKEGKLEGTDGEEGSSPGLEEAGLEELDDMDELDDLDDLLEFD